MEQYFNFSKSHNKLENHSNIVNNKGAKIEKQNFYINISGNKKLILSFLSILIIYIGFHFYQTKQRNELKEKEKVVLEKKINELNKRKFEIMNQKFDREAAIKEIDRLVD